MLTVCPKCTLTLAVTAADLRTGQGYVRCGRCATVFNALLALSDASSLELPGAAPPASHAATATVNVGNQSRHERPPATKASAVAVSDDVEADVDTDHSITIDPSLAAAPLDMVLEQTSAPVKPVVAPQTAPEPTPAPTPTPPPAPAAPTAAGIETRETSLDATGTVQTIVMEGSSISESEEFVDIDTIDSEIAAATRRALEAEARKSIASLDQDLGATGKHAKLEVPAESVAPPPVETRLTESGSVYVHDRNSLYAPRATQEKLPPSLLLWSSYAVVLLLLLGAQAIHYWRNDLAVENDWVSHSLTRLYAVLGQPLTPNWDLHGYDVRQLGAATNGSSDNAIRVRIGLTNRANRAQPWPVLRLSLYNRYGKRVAARDLQPRDYLTRERAVGMMPLAQQIESEVAVLDPGPDASSFELDVCVPGQRGLRCAGDSPLRSAPRS